MTYVKICGITRLDDARCAAEAGADFLGFVFYPLSPRFVTLSQAALITRRLRQEFGASAPRCVGVFVNEPVECVWAALNYAGLDLAQLHGDEPPEEVWMLYPRAFKAVRPRSEGEIREAIRAYADIAPDDVASPQLLIDAYHPAQFGGTGLTADLSLARSLAGHFRLLLAGGLTPETVGAAIAEVRPWGVDVSSGVEVRKGVKDHARIRAFIQAVREASRTGLLARPSEGLERPSC